MITFYKFTDGQNKFKLIVMKIGGFVTNGHAV